MQQVLKWASARGWSGARAGILCINVAGATLCDPNFPKFVADQRRIFDMPGEAFCFELDGPEVRHPV